MFKGKKRKKKKGKKKKSKKKEKEKVKQNREENPKMYLCVVKILSSSTTLLFPMNHTRLEK